MRPLHVLVVDDNAMNIELVSVVLAADGMVVESAADAAEARAMIALRRPDVVLMDMQLPGMDGLVLTRLLKADDATKDIPIVAFTAYAMKGDEAHMRSAGCDGYLSKPIDVKHFAAQLRACLPGGAA